MKGDQNNGDNYRRIMLLRCMYTLKYNKQQTDRIHINKVDDYQNGFRTLICMTLELSSKSGYRELLDTKF
jgi:hypothetical protein